MRLAARFATLMVVAALATPLSGQQRTSTLLVHVRAGAPPKPLSDAEVVVDDGALVGVTGADGWFRASNVAPGEHRIRVSYLGFRTGETVVRVSPGATAQTSLVLRVQPIPIDSLTVVTYPSTLAYDMRGFNERRKRGGGYYITRSEIEHRHPRFFSDLLRMVPGMTMDCNALEDNCRATMASAPASGVPTSYVGGMRGPLLPGGCPIQYYVDGQYQPHSNVNDLDPRNIQAVEVYVHGEEAPAQYSLRKNARCGVVLVWLRMSLRR